MFHLTVKNSSLRTDNSNKDIGLGTFADEYIPDHKLIAKFNGIK